MKDEEEPRDHQVVAAFENPGYDANVATGEIPRRGFKTTTQAVSPGYAKEDAQSAAFKPLKSTDIPLKELGSAENLADQNSNPRLEFNLPKDKRDESHTYVEMTCGSIEEKALKENLENGPTSEPNIYEDLPSPVLSTEELNTGEDEMFGNVQSAGGDYESVEPESTEPPQEEIFLNASAQEQEEKFEESRL